MDISPHAVHPGVWALAFHTITQGHLTTSLFSPCSIVASFNDKFIGKYLSFLLNTCRSREDLKGMLELENDLFLPYYGKQGLARIKFGLD